MRMHHLSGTDEKGRIYAMTYEEARSYIEYTDTMGSVLGLDSIKELLRRLGDPQDAVPVIHIAGTNGKGSVGNFIAGILAKVRYAHFWTRYLRVQDTVWEDIYLQRYLHILRDFR